jgi:hypothetical protein
MGYTAEFRGRVELKPPLNAGEIAYLRKFSHTRRMACVQGPYYVDRGGLAGQGEGPDVLHYHQPPECQPGLWCQWVPTEDGTALVWDGGEKFDDADEWMSYLIQHFLWANAHAFQLDPERFVFLQGHDCHGVIEAQGEEGEDHWALVVCHNQVATLSLVGRAWWSSAAFSLQPKSLLRLEVPPEDQLPERLSPAGSPGYRRYRLSVAL